MAAPHVTGAIALLLEENPRLTRADIVRHLQAHARDKPVGGWDATWGGGKLNIEAALAAVRAEMGGGGGGGGPRMHPPFILQESSFSGHRASDFIPLSSSANSFRHEDVIASEMEAQPFASWLQILRARLKGFPEGEHVAAAISRHFSEVRRLINSNRRIATMWHRANGPLLLRRLLHGARAGDSPLLTEEESVYRYLDRCFDLLARDGSPRLRGSLERYRALVATLLGVSIAAPIESSRLRKNSVYT